MPVRIVAAAVALGAALLPLVPARADSPGDYGYWTKTQTPTSPNPAIPVPPTVPVPPPEQVVPEGGLYVALAVKSTQPDPTQVPNPVEPAAIAALRFFVEPGSEATLNLGLADGYDADGPPQQNHPPYLVDVCVVDLVAPAWDPPDGPGRYEDRAIADCDTASTPSILEEEGQRMTWELGTAFEVTEGIIDVVLVPRGVEDPQDPTKVQPVPFQLAFEAPDEQTLLVIEPEGSDDEEIDGEGDFSLDDVDGGLFDDGLTFDDGAFRLGGDGDVADGDDGGATGGRRGSNRPFKRVARAPIALDTRGDRILAVGLLFLIGTGLWWVAGMPMRSPRLLGSLGGGGTGVAAASVATGGVGRFSRPRTGRPPRL